MTDAIPHKPITDWHRQRAAELANQVTSSGGWTAQDFAIMAGALHKALLQHIADHEDPPIDPDLLAAREIVAEFYRAGDAEFPASVLAGEADNIPMVRIALAGIKHGKTKP